MVDQNQAPILAYTNEGMSGLSSLTGGPPVVAQILPGTHGAKNLPCHKLYITITQIWAPYCGCYMGQYHSNYSIIHTPVILTENLPPCLDSAHLSIIL